MTYLDKQQRKLLKRLRSQANDVTELMKLIAASQDTDTVRKEHMGFLGTIGSRTLSAKELKMANQGIPFDELRKICGQKMLTAERNDSLRYSLPQGHVLKKVYAEHDLILYYLCDLEALNCSIQQMKRWPDNEKLLDKVNHIVRHICSMDAHQTREERIIFPQLAAHGCGDMLQDTFAEHDHLHKSRVELKTLADSIRKMDFSQWKKRLDAVFGIFAVATRHHIWQEESILYPKALNIIQDPQIWDNM